MSFVVGVPEVCFRDIGRFIEAISHSFDDECLYLPCRDPIDGTSLFGSLLERAPKRAVPPNGTTPIFDAARTDH
jgi:hypothetical protein